MSRTARYKLAYVVVLLALGGGALVAAWRLGGGVLAAAVVAVVLLVPGRVVGAFYRDLFRGRRLLDLGEPAASIPYTLRFLDDVRRHPGRKRLLWLAWSVYTPDAEAMALNNLGAAHLEPGDFGAATSALRSALAIDPAYPLPFYNLAIERVVAGDRTEAARLVAESERLGYRGTGIDALIREAQSLLARIEARVPTPAGGSGGGG